MEISKKSEKLKTFPLVTIGIISDTAVDDIGYNMCMLLGQTYPNSELIFSFDEKLCMPISDIITSIRANRKENIKSIEIHEDRDNGGIYSNIQYIAHAMRGEYITFIYLNDAYYDGNVIQNFINRFLDKPSEDPVILKTVQYNEEKSKWVSYPDVSFITGYKILRSIKKKESLKKIDLSFLSICFKSDLFRKICFPDTIESFEKVIEEYLLKNSKHAGVFNVCGIKHNKRKENEKLCNVFKIDDTAVLNHSAYRNFLCYVNLYKKDTFKKGINDLKKKINDEIERIKQLHRNAYWPISKSDSFYLGLMDELKNIVSEKYASTNLEQLLKKAEKKSLDKFKIVFFVNEFSVWPSLKSVYDTASTSLRYEVQIVYIPYYHPMSKINHEEQLYVYRKAGYPIIQHTDYDLSTEAPDIAFYVKPYEEIPESFRIKEVRTVVHTCILSPYAMEIGNTDECLEYQCRCPMHYYAWKVLAYSSVYYEKMKKYTYNHAENYVTIGHPRIDLRYEKMEKNPFYNKVKAKANERKIILWNTHFSLAPGKTWGTFLQYGEDVLNYFFKHKEIILLWRPHPLFFKALAQEEQRDLNEVEEWFSKLDSRENIIIDQEHDYLPSFAVSDALISDMTSFVPEYLAWGKSVLITVKEGNEPTILGKKWDLYEAAYSSEEIINFLGRVVKNKQRSVDSNELKKWIYIPDEGTVADELLNMIEKHF